MLVIMSATGAILQLAGIAMAEGVSRRRLSEAAYRKWRAVIVLALSVGAVLLISAALTCSVN